MIVYFGQIITVGTQGQAWRAQRCEHCGQQFYYHVGFAATGSARDHYFLDSEGSTRRAEVDAQRLLDHALRHEVFPVPCPHCALYQADMVPAVRAKLFPRMRLAARILFTLTPFALIFGCVTMNIARDAGQQYAVYAAVGALIGLPTLFLSAGVGLLAARSRRQAAYDPNSEDQAGPRRRLAAAYALKPEEFARLRVTALAQRPRGQLVGRECARCAQRISCDIDGEFCHVCGSPVHNHCARPGDGTGCPSCGAGAIGQ